MATPVPSFLRRLATPLAIALSLAACSTLEVKQEVVDKSAAAAKGPELPPFRAITGFSAGLRCMDNLMIDYGVRDVTMLVEELSDTDAYDLVFLPGPFLPPRVIEAAVARAFAALRPGGWAVLALYRGAEDLASALARLRTVRSGGSLLSTDEGEKLLRDSGLSHVSTLSADAGNSSRPS